MHDAEGHGREKYIFAALIAFDIHSSVGAAANYGDLVFAVWTETCQGCPARILLDQLLLFLTDLIISFRGLCSYINSGHLLPPVRSGDFLIVRVYIYQGVWIAEIIAGDQTHLI